jgi:hypothetical protein
MRRRRRQSAWRARNPDYFIARRIQARSSEPRTPEPLRLPAPLSRLPWDIAQSQFGVQGADFIGVMGRLLLPAAQSQFKADVIDSEGDPGPLLPVLAQSQTELGADS